MAARHLADKLVLDVAGAYNGAGPMLHWVTPPPLTSHLKTFWGPKFELIYCSSE